MNDLKQDGITYFLKIIRATKGNELLIYIEKKDIKCLNLELRQNHGDTISFCSFLLTRG